MNMYEHEHEATKGIWALDMNWKCTGIICFTCLYLSNQAYYVSLTKWQKWVEDMMYTEHSSHYLYGTHFIGVITVTLKCVHNLSKYNKLISLSVFLWCRENIFKSICQAGLCKGWIFN